MVRPAASTKSRSPSRGTPTSRTSTRTKTRTKSRSASKTASRTSTDHPPVSVPTPPAEIRTLRDAVLFRAAELRVDSMRKLAAAIDVDPVSVDGVINRNARPNARTLRRYAKFIAPKHRHCLDQVAPQGEPARHASTRQTRSSRGSRSHTTHGAAGTNPASRGQAFLSRLGRAGRPTSRTPETRPASSPRVSGAPTVPILPEVIALSANLEQGLRVFIGDLATSLIRFAHTISPQAATSALGLRPSHRGRNARLGMIRPAVAMPA